MKENTEYLGLFIIVDNTKFQQGQENVLYFFVLNVLVSKHRYATNNETFSKVFDQVSNAYI